MRKKTNNKMRLVYAYSLAFLKMNNQGMAHKKRRLSKYDGTHILWPKGRLDENVTRAIILIIVHRVRQ